MDVANDANETARQRCTGGAKSGWDVVRRWLKIPEDHDARGIVVRVLNHKYYLRPYTLRFIDPYIEVEYNLSLRRQNIRRLVRVCLAASILALHVVLLTWMYLDRDQVYALSTVNVYDVNIAASIAVVATSVAVSGCVLFGRYTYAVNWNYVYAFLVWTILLVQEKLWVDFFVNVKLMSLSLHTSNYINLQVEYANFQIKVFMAQQIIYRALPMLTFVVNLMVCVLFTQTLNFIEHLVLHGCYGCVTIAFSLYMKAVTLQYFDNDPVMTGMRQRDTSHSVVSLPLGNKTWHEMPWTYSQYDFGYYLEMQTRYIAIYWCIISLCVVEYMRNRDLLSRENFILKRVRSDKDARRVDEGGIQIQHIMKENEHESDEGILDNNIKRLKNSPSTSSDASGNEVLLQIGEKIKPMESICETNATNATNAMNAANVEGTPSAANERKKMGDAWDSLRIDVHAEGDEGDEGDEGRDEGNCENSGGYASTTDQSYLYLNDLTDNIRFSGFVPHDYTRSGGGMSEVEGGGGDGLGSLSG